MASATHSYDRRRNDNALESYMREINRHALLTREEEMELAQRYFVNKDEKAKQKLINSNLRFVVKVAYKYSSYRLDMIDLIQEGNVGLITAVERFNPNHGNRLLTYAVWWIKATIQSYISGQWALVRVLPSSQQRRLLFGRHRDVSGDTMRAEKDEAASTTDRAKREETNKRAKKSKKASLGDVARWHKTANAARRYMDLDGAVVADGRLTLGETLACPTGSAEQHYANAELLAVTRERIDLVRQRLNDKERAILDLRMLAHEPATLQQLSDKFGISRERVRQVEAAIKRKLARKLRPVMAAAS
ncbi:MAG: sigma-70 family RNA polymerase sigma factor [Myxococcales bacterium]|nr:sigma-70 family RNA polymerase sigma factor [Myxococcales bacterium]